MAPIRSPWRMISPPRARRGCTWSTSTARRIRPAARPRWSRLWRAPAASGSKPGVASATETRSPPCWLKEFGAERIILAPDVRLDAQGTPRVAAAGWQESTSLALDDFLQGFLAAGLVHILCTDISRDGRLTGPNTALYRQLATRFPALQIQASGGVSSLDDLRALQTTGAAGAIVGRALYEKKFTLKEALAC